MPIEPERRRIMSESRVSAAETARLKIAADADAAAAVVVVPLWGGILTAVVCAMA